MTSFSIADSSYRFTNPIRFFKANDPIYYEVDNIPLKQLQENDLWLKDQVTNIKLNFDGGVDRQNLNELRPYVNGSDNVVRVKPGRFTARINDAYKITPLQVINSVLGEGVTEYNVWTADSMNSEQLASTINKFKQAVELNLNGLVERAFARIAVRPDVADTVYGEETQPSIAWIAGVDQNYGQPSYPGIGVSLWNKFQAFGTPGSIPEGVYPNQYVIRQFDNTNPIIGFARLGAAETAFIKKWRGIARTSVVDVSQELAIEIPAFNDEDHFYYDESGNKQYTNATQRIDLVFIYSKPVDASSVTLNKFVANTPTTITAPTLGIVYGAGLGVDFQSKGSQRKIDTLEAAGAAKLAYNENTDDSTLADGTPKMLSHFGDEQGTSTGFNISGTFVRGSFPSPDDLMNIAPLLDEELASSSLSLIGQTVLPVAYVVVKKNASLNLDQAPIITTTDLIDIRPLFRTTELTYNERAGIAAAVPAPSLANPIVTQSELDYELKRMFTDIVARIPVIAPPSNGGGGDGGGGGGGGGGTTANAPIPRLVGGGTIYGGYNYGVGGSIGAYVNRVTPGLTKDQIKEQLRNSYGYGSLASIPDLPSWEVAKWVRERNYPSIGQYPNDRVHLSTLTNRGFDGGASNNPSVISNGTPFGCYSDLLLTSRITKPGVQEFQSTQDVNSRWRADPYSAPTTTPNNTNNNTLSITNTVFVKKTISINRESVPWMADYSVNASFLNCAPISAGSNSVYSKIHNSPIGIFIDKRPTEFTIFVCWQGRESFLSYLNIGNKDIELSNLREGNDFAGFAVINKELSNYQLPATATSQYNVRPPGESSVGVCIYPTIKFEIIGIPTGYIDQTRSFTEESETLRLI